MAATDSGFFDSNGVKIHFTDSGGDDPTVLIHGFTASVDMWRDVVPALSGRRVVALDCRGHGRSDKPRDGSAYGLAMADDVVRLLDELEIERAHIVGYSMGAEIALNLATRHPGRVQSLVAGGSGWSGRQDVETYRMVSDALTQTGSFASVLRTMTPDGEPEPTDATIAELDAMLQGQDTTALAAVARAMDELIDLPEAAIAGIGVPVLGITGELDPERGNLEKMNGVVADYRLLVLDGQDHMSAVADPRFPAAIAEFLEAH